MGLEIWGMGLEVWELESLVLVSDSELGERKDGLTHFKIPH